VVFGAAMAVALLRTRSNPGRAYSAPKAQGVFRGWAPMRIGAGRATLVA
jgi:hypothetical protein